MPSLADYLRTNPNKSSIQPPSQVKPPVPTSSPGAVSPALKSPAAQTYVQQQMSSQPQAPAQVDNTGQINDIKAKIADKQAQITGLTGYGLTDTNQLQKNAQGQYVPSNYEQAKTDYSKAYQSYIDTLNPSAEVTNAQGTYNKFMSDENTALQNISDQSIPMRFITGQQKSLESRAQNQATLLQGNIDIANKNQESRQNAGLANVSLKEKLLGMQQSPQDIAKAQQESESNKADISYKQAQTDNIAKKFDEDKREFGLQYALDQQKVAIEQQKADAVTAKNSPADAHALKDNALTSAQTLLQKFQSGSGKSAVGGNIQNRLGGFGDWLGQGTGRQDFIVQLNNLKSLLSLDNVKYLKGQGAVSDAERRLLEQASAKLDRSQSEEEFQSALQDIVKSLSGSASGNNQSIPAGTTGDQYGLPGYVSDGTQWVLQ